MRSDLLAVGRQHVKFTAAATVLKATRARHGFVMNQNFG